MMTEGAGGVGDWQHLFADLPVMYVLTRFENDSALIDACNERFVETLGYDRETLLGTPLEEVYTPESAAALWSDGYRRALRDEFTTAERELVCADGTVVHTLLRAVPRTDEDVTGTRALFIDVTAREQRRQQAAVLNRLLRHNLRNDMTILLGHASLLLEDDDLSDRTRESAKQIRDTARRWDGLIAKTQRIRKVLNEEFGWTRTDIIPVLDRVERQLDDAHPSADVHILKPSEDTATIRPEIELALTELLENAVGHADRPDPEVVVTVSAPADEPWVQITVADDGPAIPDNELVPLRDKEATPLLHGSGLGLWIVRLAVDAVGGTVSVVENDDGTVITIRYPA